MTAATVEFGRQLGSAYEAAASAWAVGASIVYDRLAEALVAELPLIDRGPVLDLCAGTGAASAALVRRGVPLIAVDFAVAMLAVDRDTRPPAVAADGFVLPFRPHVFAAVVAAFGVNHAADPVAFLSETKRVTSAGGLVGTSTFATGWAHPAKSAVDDVLGTFGFRAPDWHRQLKRDVEPATASVGALVAIAERAGLHDARATLIEVVPDVTAEEIVGWRFSMASHVDFVSALSTEARRRATKAAIAEVRERWEPFVVPMLVMSARA